MSRKGSYCFIINCASNAHASEMIFKKYEPVIKSEFPDSDLKYIRTGDCIKEFVEAHLDTYNHFVACGGDGTVNSVANALVDTEAVLGILPLGSGNDFAQNIGLFKNFEQDLKILKNNRIKQVDAILVNGEYMVNTCGTGVDGLTNYYASKSPFRWGFLKYFFGGLTALLKSCQFDITYNIDGKGSKAYQNIWMVTVANGKTEGGRYKISPNSDNSDGIADVIIVKGVSRILLIREFIKLSFGRSFDPEVMEIQSFQDTMELRNSIKLHTHLDGEQKGQLDRFEFSMNKGAIKVVVGS